jgi:hypothetical protein
MSTSLLHLHHVVVPLALDHLAVRVDAHRVPDDPIARRYNKASFYWVGLGELGIP